MGMRVDFRWDTLLALHTVSGPTSMRHSTMSYKDLLVVQFWHLFNLFTKRCDFADLFEDKGLVSLYYFAFFVSIHCDPGTVVTPVFQAREADEKSVDDEFPILFDLS
jgi:hypothetical protein